MPTHWLAFAILVVALVTADLAVLQRPGRAPSVRAAWAWTAILAALAGGWAIWTGATSGKQPAIEFVTGYVIEGSLSIDNLFVFLMLFRALRLEAEQQHRVLLWGVLGAIVLRGVLIAAGATLLVRFAWVQYAFGALLALAAVRLLLAHPGATSAHGPVKWIETCCLRYGSGMRLTAGSLLMVIVAVEATDLLFALDSIPAVLAVTRNSWIAFTSNIFAVLGLRSLYFALSGLLGRFRLLHYGLATIMGFVAFKMLAARWVDIPALWSLAVIAAILAIFAGASTLLAKPARASG
jgi:tellurite resistance protein TerC